MNICTPLSVFLSKHDTFPYKNGNSDRIAVLFFLCYIEEAVKEQETIETAKSEVVGAIKVNEFNEYVRERFSAVGDIVIKAMMGGYLVYLDGKLIGDIGGKELFLKRTPTSDRLLADSELRYPYAGSKTLMHVFDRFEDTDLIAELLEGMYAELPEKKPKKAK